MYFNRIGNKNNLNKEIITMELDKFIANFAEQLDDTDPAEIKADTIFRQLDEWSSLSVMCTIAMVDAEYGVALKGDDINKAQTVEDLFNVVKSKKA